MKSEIEQKVRTAAGLACQLRALLEEIGEDYRNEGEFSMQWEFEDQAADTGQIESALDALVETFS
jgi:hypothetical protein